jgi:hypothetical protein
MGVVDIIAVYHILYLNDKCKKDGVAEKEKCIERSRQ